MLSTQGSRKASLCCLLAAIVACASGCAADSSDQHRQIAVFGTIVTLQTFGVGAATTDAATRALEQRYRALGEDWYPWADGELARINSAIAQREAVRVSPELKFVLQRAADLERRSDGRFNAGLGELTELWGFHQPGQTNWQPPKPSRIAELLTRQSGAAQLHWSGDVLTSPVAFKLDLGGLAKGAILMLSRRILDEHGIHNAIIDIGGDLMVVGDISGRAARIGIRRPGQQDALAWVDAASGEAVMTSGNYERYFEHHGRRYAHILDPATGYPADGVASVTVIDADPLLADAAATALLVAGATSFDALCEQLGIEHALLVSTTGDLRLTAAMQGRVNWVAD